MLCTYKNIVKIKQGRDNDINSLVIDTTFIFTRYIGDIYSFAVNTIHIVIECNENISIFTSAKHE